MNGPLSGVTVLELPAIGPVPFLGMMLADLGAEVVRIQKPRAKRSGLEEVFVGGPLGRGRRQLELDLQAHGASEVVLRLAERSDALIEGFRPGVAERLGVGPDEVLSRNRRLVYGRLTGWGQDGPLARTAGHDITYLAISGLLHGIGARQGPPVPPVNYLADLAGGSLVLGMGLLAAILHARESGVGQVLDAAMTEGAAYLGTMTRTLLDSGSWRDERESNLLDGGSPNYRCYECADGRWVAIGAIEPQFWATLCNALGSDSATVPSPYDHRQALVLQSWLTDAFRTRTRDEWAELFTPLDACVAPVLTLTEAPAHPHNAARHAYAEFEGKPVAAPAPRFSATATGVAAGAIPTDGLEIMRQLDYTEADLAVLRESGVIT
ncbi:MAG TPA: CaiB/BaiF CoA-transferase family protein [Jatrophihabitans sp.]|jgi:alpha-methylacyl-CoA racemase